MTVATICLRLDVVVVDVILEIQKTNKISLIFANNTEVLEPPEAVFTKSIK